MNEDMRVVRTKEAIRAAFIELLDEKGFNSITVKDITTRAHVNRSTFYMHYEDKYDLMEQLQRDVLEQIPQLAKRAFTEITEELGHQHAVSLPLPLAVSIFEYLDENRKLMRALLGPEGDLSFQTKLKKLMWKALIEDRINPLIKQERMSVPSDYLIAYVASAHIGVIQQWLNGDRQETPEEMARILFTLSLHGPFYAATGIRPH